MLIVIVSLLFLIWNQDQLTLYVCDGGGCVCVMKLAFLLHFSMKNIYQLCDWGRAMMWSNNGVSQWRSLFTDICVTLSAAVPPPGGSKISVRQYLIDFIRDKYINLLFLI